MQYEKINLPILILSRRSHSPGSSPNQPCQHRACEQSPAHSTSSHPSPLASPSSLLNYSTKWRPTTEGGQQCRAGHGRRPATTPSSLGMGSGGGGGGRMRQSDRGIKRSLAAIDPAPSLKKEVKYLTYFEPRVTGVLRYGSLTGLSGVKVRRFLVWFDVVRVKVDLPPPPRYVYLDIGWITRKLPADEFESPHECEDSKKCRLSSALATVAAWFQGMEKGFGLVTVLHET
uniref:Uncharacterized protein n=1 Tax=Oryza barthii TaxID=65489 RepID=A0A0D3FMQ1_9ORYZ